jgi:hypothetical protein
MKKSPRNTRIRRIKGGLTGFFYPFYPRDPKDLGASSSEESHMSLGDARKK